MLSAAPQNWRGAAASGACVWVCSLLLGPAGPFVTCCQQLLVQVLGSNNASLSRAGRH